MWDLATLNRLNDEAAERELSGRHKKENAVNDEETVHHVASLMAATAKRFIKDNDEQCDDCTEAEWCPIKAAAEGNEIAAAHLALEFLEGRAKLNRN